MMAGLNHEETQAGRRRSGDRSGSDQQPARLLGAHRHRREAAVLFRHAADDSRIRSRRRQDRPSAELTKVTIQCPQLCPRYTARVIRGVKVKPSPKWLVDRLATLGIAAINNVVDITNYVLMECGQPLHAFDFRKLDGQEIIVREARSGERFEAINHKTYELEPGMCVIADAAGRSP